MRLLQFTEAAYPGNIGFEEMVEFWKVASDQDIKKMEKITDKGDWVSFVKLIKSVTGRKLNNG
jgi:hypothetical protein